MPSVLLLGATGATGKQILHSLLNNPAYTKVGEIGRRVTPQESLTGDKSKLTQEVIDFEKLESVAAFKESWDVVITALGTTRTQAGNNETYTRIDKDYPIAAATAAKSASKTQKLLQISSVGANASSMFFYPRLKGETEHALASLGYSETVVFRPGFLANANRGETPILESLAGVVMGALSCVSDSAAIPVETLARAVTTVGLLDSSALAKEAAVTRVTVGGKSAEYKVVDNATALRLGTTAK